MLGYPLSVDLELRNLAGPESPELIEAITPTLTEGTVAHIGPVDGCALVDYHGGTLAVTLFASGLK